MNTSNYTYKLIRSDRKTLALQIKQDMQLIVRAPRDLSDSQISDFVAKHQSWIEKTLKKQRQINLQNPPITPEEIEHLKSLAKEIIPQMVTEYGSLMGLSPSSVTITSAKTRFGSCSSKGALCFSYLLMRYPEEAVEYVVVHELAHLVHHNHGQAFYALIEKYLPDYKKRRQLLKKPLQV